MNRISGDGARSGRTWLRLWLQSTVISTALLLGVFLLLGVWRPDATAAAKTRAVALAKANGPGLDRTPLVSSDGGIPFDDIRRDAVLVGVRATVDQFFGRWDVIFSIQPIYRLKDGEIARGEIHGVDRGLEIVSEAKSGYAVGRLAVSHGGAIDGLRCVFMRERDGKLDPADQYNGRWIGARSDSKPDEVATGGKVAIGIHGRAEGELHALGLLLSPDAN